MVEVIFSYKGTETVIQSNKNNKMKDIINQFINKILKNDLLFIYSGKIINEELTFEQQANELDKDRKKMNILVFDNDEAIKKDNIKQSKESICPKCYENILLKIKDFKISYECKNNHKMDNILLSEYLETQKIDLSKILCNKCLNNKNNIFNNEF